MLDPGLQVVQRVTFTLILFWLIQLFNPAKCCSELFINHLGTTTSDMSIVEGDPMEINCTLFTSSMDLNDGRRVNINSKMLFFKYNGSRITNSKIRVVDNLTISYKIDQTSITENGYYMCYLDISETSVKPRAVCATYITIARAPSANDNFNLNCSGYDLKNFTCSWDLQDYNIATTYDLSIVLAGDLIYSTCPKRIGKNSCTFSTTDKSPYLISDKKLRFRLDVTNKFGSISKMFEIDHYSNVILGPVEVVYPVTIRSNFILINWDPPRSIAHDTYLDKIIEYQLKIYPVKRDDTLTDDNNTYRDDDVDDDTMETKYGESFLIKELKHYNLIGLIPYTRYNIEIRCRLLTDVGQGKWSQESLGSVETKPDLPYSYPILHPGAIELIQQDEDKQDVVIYFDKVDKMHVNGPNFTYSLRIRPFLLNNRTPSTPIKDTAFTKQSTQSPPIHSSSNDLKSSTSIASTRISPEPIPSHSDLIQSQLSSKLCRLSLGDITSEEMLFAEIHPDFEIDSCTIENMNTSFDYQLQMLSRNSIGFSSGFSYIIVPGEAINTIHPGVDQLYAINWSGNNYTLYWTVHSNQSVKYYTIFWCEMAEDSSQCDSDLKRLDVLGIETSAELTIDFNRVKFGISVLDENYGLSSGIKWADCIESGSMMSVKNRFKRFNVISDGSKSIRVGWRLDCPALDHFIDHYEMHYCRIDYPCSQTLTVINIVNSSTEYNIDNLHSSTGYNVTLLAVTIKGDELKSPTITIETKVNVLSLAFLIIIIIAAIITIFLILYTLTMCTLRKRNDEKKLKQSVDSNWIPKMPSRLKGDANILLNPLPQEALNEYENKEYMNSDSNTNINKLNSVLGSFDQQLTKDGKHNNVIILSTISGNNQLYDIIPCSSLSSSSSSSTAEEPDEGLELSSSLKNHQIGSNRSNLIRSFSSVSSTSSKKQRSRNLSGGCDSEDSGYSTKLSDKNVYYKGDTFTINGLIKSIDENSPYIVVPDGESSGIAVDKQINSSNDCNIVNNNYATINGSLSDCDLSCNDQMSITINQNDYQPPFNGYLPSGHHECQQEDINTTLSNGYVCV